ncbi:MAG: biotin-dependent carboxyltransferase [Chloroflexi bacterium]|nr:biotin-dependent carboxyltransferase [Chloroflexota bacterium]
MLEVLSPGLSSIVVDAGRRAGTDLGVPAGGACDPLALQMLERLVDGEPGTTAALEMTLTGATFTVRETCVVALTGADMEAHVPEERRDLSPGACSLVRAGTTLRFGAAVDGARTYLSMAGGLDVPLVMGSRSTCLAGGFGGVDGRALRTGDRLRSLRRGDVGLAGRRWSARQPGVVPGAQPVRLRIVPGPHRKRFAPGMLDRLAHALWTVSSRSDRVGLMLDGPPLGLAAAGDLLSLPMVWGAIQVPADGQPICLLTDHQTVGGYPVPAVVASVDRSSLGQLRPGDSVRFEVVSTGDARALMLDAQAAFAGALAAMSRDEVGEALA